MSIDYTLRCQRCGYIHRGVRVPDFDNDYFNPSTREWEPGKGTGPSELEVPAAVMCPNGCGQLARPDMTPDELEILQHWQDGGYAVRAFKVDETVVVAVGKTASVEAVLFVAEGDTLERALKVAREYMGAIASPSEPDLPSEDLTDAGFALQWGVSSRRDAAHWLWPWRKEALATPLPITGTPAECLARAREALL